MQHAETVKPIVHEHFEKEIIKTEHAQPIIETLTEKAIIKQGNVHQH